MPVDLKNIPGVSHRPVPPRLTRWMSVLVILIGFSLFLSRLLTGENNMWLSAGIPCLVVGGLLLILFLIYLLRQIFANARDMQREKTIIQEVRRGRRALQILVAECCTAHSLAGASFAPVVSHLLSNENVLFPQRSWRGEANVRLSQLARISEMSAEEHLGMLFNGLVKQLAPRFSQLLAETPIMLLLEPCSSLSEERVEELWLHAWNVNGIRQCYSRISGSGMQVVDDWLDHQIRSEALLLVVSLKYAPADTLRSGETVNAVLMGNRLTQDTLLPLAYLHRPEAAKASPEELHYGITQALDWVPVKSEIPEHLWLSGVTADTDEYAALMKAIDDASLNKIDELTGKHNFNEFLGDPGKAAVWLAVAAATQSMQQHLAHHLLISREQQTGKVWNMVVSPVTPAKEGEA